MVGRLEAGGRVAAAALLALGSLAPLEGPLLATPPAVNNSSPRTTARISLPPLLWEETSAARTGAKPLSTKRQTDGR